MNLQNPKKKKKVGGDLTHPVTIRIINVRETSDRLLPAARTVGHIMRMQPKPSLLMHQLKNRPIRDLYIPK